LSLLGHLSKEILKRAIELKEVQTLIKVPGIGKKSAERIIVELSGKLDPFSQENSLIEDGVQALVNIGYSSVEARKKILKAQESVVEKTDLQELLKVALQTKI
jgi:Holliday junction DNA helicase RuvA